MTIYRQQALEHFNAQEEMPPYLMLIHPGAWWWVAVSCVFLLALLAWAIFGRVSLTVQTSGIVLPENSHVLPISSLQSGSVTSVFVKPGMKVKKGTLLAQVTNPYVDEDLTYLQKINLDNEKIMATFKEQYKEQTEALTQQFAQQMQILNANLKDQQDKVHVLTRLYTKKLEVFKRHYLSEPDLEKAREDMVEAQEQLAQLQLKISQVPEQYKVAITELEEKLHQHVTQYLESKHNLDIKMLEKSHGLQIVSNQEGVVVGVSIAAGDYISVGKTLFTLLTDISNKTLDALVFIDHMEGKKIKAGMAAYVLPSTVSPYEYGYIKGEVISISDYPLSKEFVYSYLGNINLVDEYFTHGSPFMAKVRLLASSTSKSGLLWTTRKGAPFKFEPGATVTVKIVSTECSPLKLLTQH